MKNKKIIICPYSSRKKIMDYVRKDDPFIDVKFITKEELIHDYYGRYSTDTICYLVRKYHLSFEMANIYLRNLIYITHEGKTNKTTHLFNLREELIAHKLLVVNSYLSYEMNEAEVKIYDYYPKDTTISYILDELKAKYEFIYENVNSVKKDVYAFKSIEEEMFYVFNQISEYISSGSVKPNDIYVYGVNDDYRFLFDRAKAHYHLSFNAPSNRSLVTSLIVQDFLSRFYETDIDISLQRIRDSYDDEWSEKDAVIRVINNYKLSNEPTDENYHLYEDAFKSATYPKTKYDGAINIIDDISSFPENGYLFIIGFNQGVIPHVARDNDYLSDEEKNEFHINSSREANNWEVLALKQVIFSAKNISISYKKKDLVRKVFPSPLVKELSMNILYGKEKIQTVHSETEASLKCAMLKDKKRKYLAIDPELKAYAASVTIPYLKYDYKYTGVDVFNSDSELFLSYTGLNLFYQCGFAYYLGKVLKIDESEETFMMNVGNLAHAIFEQIKNEDYDFDKEFKKFVGTYSFTKRELVILTRVKDELKRASKIILEHRDAMTNPSILTEHPVRVKVDERTTLIGKIDKVVATGENQEYLSIIDYKTGSENFNEKLVPFGLSMQLPVYAYMASEDRTLSQKELIGIYIQHVLPSKFVRPNAEETEKSLQLRGMAIEDMTKYASFDSSLNLSEPSKYVNSMRYKTGEVLAKTAKVRSQTWFEDMAKLAFDLIIKASEMIRNNEFSINPKIMSSTKTSCSYCPYRDICFRKDDAFVDLELGEGEVEEDE